jgi:hypothetical protein
MRKVIKVEMIPKNQIRKRKTIEKEEINMNILLSKIRIEPEAKKEHFDIFEFRKTIVFKSLE